MSELLTNYNDGEYSESFQKMMNRAMNVIRRQSVPSRNRKQRMEITMSKFNKSIFPKIAQPKTQNSFSKDEKAEILMLDNYFETRLTHENKSKKKIIDEIEKK